MTAIKNLSGTITCSDIVNGQLIKKQYVGYTVKEAKKLFKAHCSILTPIYPNDRYIVKTETKGILSFSELPKGTYFQEGSQNIEEKGTAMYYTYDNGTCLIPIIDTTTGKQVIDISRAGKSII